MPDRLYGLATASKSQLVNGLDWMLLDVTCDEEADDQVIPEPSDEVLAISRWNGLLSDVISEQSQVRSFIDVIRVEDVK